MQLRVSQVTSARPTSRSAARGALAAPARARAPARQADAQAECSTSGNASESIAWQKALFGGLATLALLGAPMDARALNAEQGVEEYSALVEGGKLNQKSLENLRSKYNFRRGQDGRVWVKSSKNEWYCVRLDMEVPGAMLFRSPSGQIFALQTEQLQQIDLSSDQVVMLMLADQQWEQEMSPIQFEDPEGGVKTLTLNENDFRNVVGLISVAQQGEDEAAAPK